MACWTHPHGRGSTFWGRANSRPNAQCAMAMLRRSEPVDDQALRHQLAIDTRDAQRLLGELVQDGWLVNPRQRGGSFEVGARVRDALEPPALMPRSVAGVRRPAGRSGLDVSILSVLTEAEPMNVHEIAEATKRTIGSVRRRLNVLVDQGQVRATASPTSRNRAYLLVAHQH